MFDLIHRRNIYIRPPESGSMRDIFLQPFNNRLLLCVAFVELIIVLAIGSINYAAKNMFGNSMEKNEGLGDATLWCTGIICMQGSRDKQIDNAYYIYFFTHQILLSIM